MSAALHARDADETRPLLHDHDDHPHSYHSASSSRTQSPEPAEPPSLNKISRSDLIWVLAGLWSAVFLGALDGVSPSAYSRSLRSPRPPRARNDRRNTAIAHRELL